MLSTAKIAPLSVMSTAGVRSLAVAAVVALCALVSGVLFFLSTNLGNIWPLAWIAPVPILWLAYGRSRPWLVFAAGFAAFAIGQLTLFEAYSIMAPTLLALLIITSGAFGAGAVFAELAHRSLRPVIAVLAFPAYWTAFEFAYMHASPNGSYGSLSYSQVAEPVFIQSAALVGLGGVTFLICLVANAIALLLRDGHRALPAAALAAVLFGSNLALGYTRLEAHPEQTIRVAAAASDDQRFGWTEGETLAIAKRYATEAQRLAAGGAQVVVFSEKGAILKPSWSRVISLLQRTARKTHATIVAGFEEHGSVTQNVALTFESDGSIVRYAKQRLLVGFENYRAGAKPGILAGGEAVEICKDMDYPDGVRTDVRGRDIRLMLVPALDFSIDGRSHANIAVMRSVEDGFALVRAARFGLLTANDAEGRILALARSDSRGERWILATVPVGPGQTPFLLIGDAFDWLCGGFTIFAGALVFSRTKNSDRPDETRSDAIGSKLREGSSMW